MTVKTGASKADVTAFIAQAFPNSKFVIETLGNGECTVKYPVTENDLRPGGTVSGPVLMAVADVALYVALLGDIGIVPLAVTSNLNINFLRKPAANCNIIGKCRLLKVGKLLAVGEVSLYSEGQAEPVAHAVVTYAIPQA